MTIDTLITEAQQSIDEMVGNIIELVTKASPHDLESEAKANELAIKSIRSMGKRLYDIAATLETCSDNEADILLNKIELEEALAAMWTLTGKLATTGECNEHEN